MKGSSESAMAKQATFTASAQQAPGGRWRGRISLGLTDVDGHYSPQVVWESEPTNKDAAGRQARAELARRIALAGE